MRKRLRRLEQFFENPFDSRNISLDELIAFATDHLQRMIAHNGGGLFTARIAATSAALGALGAGTTEQLTKLGLRRARKLAKRAFRKGLGAQVFKIYAAVVAQFGVRGPEVAECFPQGRRVFSQCPDDRLVVCLQTLHTGVLAHQAAVGAPVVSAAAALLSTWQALHAASEAASGAKSAAAAGWAQARRHLQLELFRNLLTLALMFPRESDKLALYMTPSLLEDRPSKSPAPVP